MSTAPSKRMKVEAVPVGNQFYGRFTLPGQVGVAYVNTAPGVRATFATARAAEQAALDAANGELARQRLVTAPPESRRGSLRKLDKRELAAEMDAAGVSAADLDYILGTKGGRVMDWLSGKEEASHPARVILALLRQDRRLVDVAKAVTKQARDGH